MTDMERLHQPQGTSVPEINEPQELPPNRKTRRQFLKRLGIGASAVPAPGLLKNFKAEPATAAKHNPRFVEFSWDDEGPEVAYYQIRLRQGGGPWSRWQVVSPRSVDPDGDNRVRLKVKPKKPRQPFELQVRLVDREGNKSPWTKERVKVKTRG